MISRLRGTVWSARPPSLVLDVNGVGYELDLPLNAFVDLPPGREQVLLHTHQVSREDGQFLYGFPTEAERDLFRRLLKLNGIGPKLALVLLSSLPPEELADCVARQDLTRLCKVPGIGKKTAERLLLELRDKLDAFGSAGARIQGSTADVPRNEAEAALLALGYTPKDAQRMLDGVPGGEGMAVAELIRAALRQAAR